VQPSPHTLRRGSCDSPVRHADAKITCRRSSRTSAAHLDLLEVAAAAQHPRIQAVHRRLHRRPRRLRNALQVLLRHLRATSIDWSTSSTLNFLLSKPIS